MSEPGRPLYVPRSNEQAFAPPYLQEGCGLYGFWLRCEPHRLQAICDRFLNQPSQGALRIEVAAPYVLLYFCRFDRSQSLHPSDIERGWLGEEECGLWLVVRDARPAQEPALAFFPFMMFVDSAPAAISGRELLGFPKEIGHLALPRRNQAPVLLSVDALVFPGRGRDVAGRWSRLIEVAQVPEGVAGASRNSSFDVRSLTRSALQALRRSPRGLPLLLLKQIRDAAEPKYACHQSVVQCAPRVLALRALRRLPGRYAVRIRDTESHPLSTELGVEPSALAATRGFYVELDFTLQHDRVLWEAT